MRTDTMNKSVPINLDSQGKISVQGKIIQMEANLIILTQFELRETKDEFDLMIMPYENQVIYLSEKLIEKEYDKFKKISTAYGQELEVKLSNLRYYRKGDQFNLWFLPSSEIELLEKEQIHLPKPKIWDLGAEMKDGSFMLWIKKTNHFFTMKIEEIKERKEMLTDKALQWFYQNNLV